MVPLRPQLPASAYWVHAMNVTHLTNDLPGTGGRLRHDTADFLVEELPRYEPCGSGDHLYVRIEKRGVSTMDAVRRVARALGVRPRDVGYAGLKDTRAVSVQTLSIEHVTEARAEAALADVPGLRVLGLARHRNKLKLGHLRGNRFVLRLRGVVPDAEERARRILGVLSERGCPNRFGEQRFGMRNDNDVAGCALVRGAADEAVLAILGLGGPLPTADQARALLDELPRGRGAEAALLREISRGQSPERALRAVPRNLLRLLVSAFQSRLFNRLLDARIQSLDVLEEGDLAYLHDRGAVFAVTDVVAEQPRADELLISPSGPLFGTRTTLASGAPGERERALLNESGVAPDDFRRTPAGEFRGERRPLRVPLIDAEAEDGPDVDVPDGDAESDGPPQGSTERTLIVRFSLPRGSYATSVLAEIMKLKPAVSGRQP